MKKLILLLWLLPYLGFTQTLQNLPAGFTLRTYPGNPLTLRFNVSGTEPVPTPITAVLRYGKGLIAMPVAQQPVVTTNGREFAVIWGNYPAEPGNQYLEIKLGVTVTVGGSIQSSYIVNPDTPVSQSLTISHVNLPPIALSVSTGGISTTTLNQAVAAKADTSTVYSRSTLNGLLAARLAVSQYNQDMQLLIGSINQKASVGDAYLKAESDSRYKPVSYVATWSALPDRPSLFSGNYSDLFGRPTIPATAGDLGAYTTTQVDNLLNPKATTAALLSHTGNLANPHGTTAAQTGAYTATQTDNLLLLRLPVVMVPNKAALTGSATGSPHWIETDLDDDFGTASVSLWTGTKLLTFPTLTR